ncbi:MAG: LptF/LptG family permease, partial [Deltaproteobacteria bacterium]
MPHIIQRYIFREMAIPFLFSIGIFTITSLLSKIPHLIQLMINHGVGFLVVVQFIVFILPSILIYVIPVSFLIAVLIAYNRLSSDNEITAMKASGLSILKISRSVAIMALFAYSISSFFTIHAFPWGSLSSKRLIYDMA